MNKQNMAYPHTMEYYLDIKKERSTDTCYIITWMNFGNIMPSQNNQSEQATYYMIPFI